MQPQHVSVSELMSQPALVVGPDWLVSDVCALAEQKHAHHFPIVEEGALIGIVCTCDLREATPAQAVRTYARRNVATIAPTRNVADAARLMAERAVGSAVVMGPDGILGIVTRADLQHDEKARSLLEEGHCAACGTSNHLRPAVDGTYLCVDCSDRARGDDWFDIGAGD
jgi:predicted transcriptional regulator